jgi:hypothetical protein
MTHNEQIDRFQKELVALISKYAQEYDLPVGSVIGVLEMVKSDVIETNRRTGEEEE